MQELVYASTTEDQETLDRVSGATAAAEGEQDSREAQEQPMVEDHGERHKTPGQRRFDAITRQKYKAEERATAAEERALAAERKTAEFEARFNNSSKPDEDAFRARLAAEVQQLPHFGVIQHFVSTHPQINTWLSSLPPAQQFAYIWRMNSDWEAGMQAASEQPEPENRAPRATAGVSNAPAPIKPLSGSNTKSSMPLDDLPYQDFRRAREAQIRMRRGVSR
jgi:hypothetical protein